MFAGKPGDALAAFKSFVHKRLDEAGIPTHPNGPHSACRIGDRLDLVLYVNAQSADVITGLTTDLGNAQVARDIAAETAAAAVRERDAATDEVKRLRKLLGDEHSIRLKTARERDEARQRAELEAAGAAILRQIAKYAGPGPNCTCRVCEMWVCASACPVGRALADECGKPLLEELERKTAALEAAYKVMCVEGENDLDEWNDTLAIIENALGAALRMQPTCTNCGDTGHPSDECAAMPARKDAP